MEDSLIDKTFYQSILQSGNRHPMDDLSDLFLSEQRKDIPDSSYIRFAQGEVYYHHKDYEAAIYKWENVHNELEPWAKKNIADAYTKMELYSTAEKIYQSIDPESKILKMEILLGLFHLYVKQEKIAEADQRVKEMIKLDPDYANVSDLARTFYEEQGKWFDAVNLAIQEAIRTKEMKWFEQLNDYVQKGYTHELELDLKRLTDALTVLYQIDFSFFEQLLSNLWRSYKETPHFIRWINEITNFLLKLDRKTDRKWQQLPNILRETYEHLTSGLFLYSTVSDIMPNFLRIWIEILPVDEAAIPSAYAFAWNEKNGNISKDVMERAEKTIFHTPPEMDILENLTNLYQKVEKWAENNQLNLHQIYKQLLKEMLDDSQIVGVLSTSHSEKMYFIHSFVNESIFYEIPSPIVSLIKYDRSLTMEEITDSRVDPITDFEQFQITCSKTRPTVDRMVHMLVPNRWLKDYQLTILDIPETLVLTHRSKLFFDYLYALDSLVFYCNESELKESDFSLLQEIQRKFPKLPICCVIQEQKGKGSQKDMLAIETKNLVEHGIQGTVVYYSPAKKRRKELAHTLKQLLDEHQLKNERLIKYAYYLQRVINHLYTQREQMENQLLSRVEQLEDLSSRIQGVIHQLKDLEEETIAGIRHSFQMVKEDVRGEIIGRLPKLLKERANAILEKTDQKMIRQVNNGMHEAIEKFIFEEIRPLFSRKIQDWLTIAENELKKGKIFLEEVNEGFYSLTGERQFHLQWDFQMVNDWRRDVDRLAGRIVLERKPILSPYTPYQLFFTSTGKIFDFIKRDKTAMMNRYKQYIERKDFERVTQSVAETFFSSFAILENGFEQDISLFFQPSFEQLEKFEKDLREEITEKKLELEKLKENPASFTSPLSFFDIIRLQSEFLLRAQQSYVPVLG